MRIVKMSAVALLAVVAFAAVAAAGASAHQWLDASKPLTIAKPIAVKSTMTFRVTESAYKWFKPEFTCRYNEVGTVGPGGVAEITKITNSTGGAKISCEILRAGEAHYEWLEIEAEGLPWKTELATYGTSGVEEVFNKSGKWSEHAKWLISGSSTLGGKESQYCAAAPFERLERRESGLWVDAWAEETAAECNGPGFGRWTDIKMTGPEEIKLTNGEGLEFE